MDELKDIQLPLSQPISCAACPLLGLATNSMLNSKYSPKKYVCLGTMMTMQKLKTRSIYRHCDAAWDVWMTLPQRKLYINSQLYAECRIPLEDIIAKNGGELNEDNIARIDGKSNDENIAKIGGKWNEKNIAKIGGKLVDDYQTFKKDVDYINIYYFELFSLMGLTDDISLVIEALQTHNLYSAFYAKIMRDIDEGKMPKDELLSPKTKAYLEALPPEEKWTGKSREQRCINVKISFLFRDTAKKYMQDNKIFPFCPKHNHKALEIFRDALYVAPSQIAIDVDKFVDIYINRLAVCESEAYKIHQKAVDIINQFFNGIDITEKEWARYFVLEDGVMRVNPKSINKESYARLGWRPTINGTRKTKAVSGEILPLIQYAEQKVNQ